MKTILCFGDSNTWGYDSRNDTRFSWEKRYPGILSKMMGEGYHVIENGLCGRTTKYESELEPFINGMKAAEFCREVHMPLDYVVLMLGTNDCKDMYEAEVEDICEGIKDIGHCFFQDGTQIVLVAPPVMRCLSESPFFKEFGYRAEEKSGKLKKAYKGLAEKEGWLFLDADMFVRASDYDRIHLDREGNRILAEAISIVIKDKENEK